MERSQDPASELKEEGRAKVHVGNTYFTHTYAYSGQEPTNDRLAFHGQCASGSARQHNGNVVNNSTYHYSLRKRESDETLKADQRNQVLLRAAAEGQTPRVKYLLRLGVDLDYSDDQGFTALHHATLSGFEDVVEVLLEAGTDVNAQSLDYGTPLHFAALRSRQNVAIMLVNKYRANVNANAKWVGTPLHCAALVGNSRISRLLVEKGARLDLTSAISLQKCALSDATFECFANDALYEMQAPCPALNGLRSGDGFYYVFEGSPLSLAKYQDYIHLAGMLLYSGCSKDQSHRYYISFNPNAESFREHCELTGVHSPELPREDSDVFDCYNYRHDGSSSATRRVMGFFRRRGRDRSET